MLYGINIRIVLFGFIVFHSMISISALAGPFDVFVSIQPQRYLVEQVGGEHVRVHVLVAAGQSPHTFEASPRQVEKLSGSRVYFSIGLPFEEVLVEKVIATSRKISHIKMDRNIPKRTMESGHDSHGAHKTSIRTDHGSCGTEEKDPHIWLSPELLKIQATTICEGLVAIDPDHTVSYRSNLARFVLKINVVDKHITEVLSPLKGRSLYVFHPAFGYMTDAYGLKQIAIEVEGKSPTPKNIANFIARARADGVKVIFVQKQFDKRSAMTIAQALGGDVVSLDPLSGNVLENLKSMAEEIRKALSRE